MKNWLISRVREFLIFFFAVCVKWYWASYFPDYIFYSTGDSPTYVIDSIKHLSWYHRMPGYQIFLLITRNLLGEKGLDEILFYTTVAKAQIILGALSCVIFYWILKKICKRDWLAIIGTLLYAAQPCIVNCEIQIMTEALAIDMMIIWVYFLVSFLQNPQKGLARGIGIYSLLITLTRPSFVILFPILFLFWGIRLLCEKEERSVTYWGIGGLALSSILLCLYCVHNQTITGHFMLSDVSFNNQCSILIENNIYQNENYPEIVGFIDEKLEEDPSNSLSIAKQVLWKLPYDGVQYMRDTMRQNARDYVKVVLHRWRNNLHRYIYELDGFICTDRMINVISDIQKMLLPISFAVALVLCLFEFCRGIIVWCVSKKVPYMNMGFPVLIISIMVLSFGTLTHASAQRICVHMLPVILIMILYMLDQMLNVVNKLMLRGENK